MAIYIHNSYPSIKERNRNMEDYHHALVGSAAYINNEIAILKDGNTGFILAIGMDNDSDLHEYIG